MIQSKEEKEAKWVKVIQHVQDSIQVKSEPDMNAILFLIGIQEYGNIQSGFTKEEKQELINIGLCSLLSQDGYYKKTGLDDNGWPVYKQLKNYDIIGVKKQEQYLKIKIVNYFNLEEE
jgi:hypothetical protein